MTTNRFGKWTQAKSKISKLQARISTEISKTNIKNGLILQSEIKKGIVSQSPGGKKFTKLAKNTIDKKGSSKALIDKRMLFNSVTLKTKPDSVFVGILKTKKNKKGNYIANIAAVMEFGAIVKKGKTNIKIPARPFVLPVFNQLKDDLKSNYSKALGSIL